MKEEIYGLTLIDAKVKSLKQKLFDYPNNLRSIW